MALIVTPGADNADSFGSYAEFTAYCQAVGITPSVEATAEIELRKAARYLENQYRGKWKGYKSSGTQALAWPRTANGDNRMVQNGTIVAIGVVDVDGYEIPTDVVPTPVKHAQFEAALLVKDGVDLQPRLERGGAIKSISQGVGPLQESITYADSASVMDRITVIEGLLRGLVTGTPGASVSTVAIVRG